MNFYLLLLAALALKHELSHSWLIGTNLYTLVNITIGMTGDSDRFLPILYTGANAGDGDRRTKYGAIHDASDGSVGAFPHLV